MSDLKKKKKERTCSLHKLLLSIFKEKAEPCFIVVVFLWKVFEPFCNYVMHMGLVGVSVFRDVA